MVSARRPRRAHDTQRIIHLRKPRWSSGNPLLASQRAGAAWVVHRSLRPRSVRGHPAAVRPRPHRRAGEDADAAAGENAMKRAWNAAGKVPAGFREHRYQHERQPAGIEPGAGDLAPQTALGEQKLDPPAPAPAGRTRAPLARAHARHEGASNRPRKPSIGLTGMACSLAPGMLGGIRRRTDVERQQIVRDRRAAAADHAAAGKIKVDDLVLVETRPAKRVSGPVSIWASSTP